MRREIQSLLMLVAVVVAVALPAHGGEIALLLEQPYGHFGAFNPTGHAAIYLSGVCAATPVRLRPCRRGEAGVVISRYRKIAGYDWIAVPLLPYLYATSNPEKIPRAASRATAQRMRDAYRRRHLVALAPDSPGGEPPHGEWTELVGESYLRTIYGFELPTTPQQDEALIRALNSHRNHGHFNLLFNNCANFAEKIVNFYYPHSIHRNFILDFGVMTPKQASRSLRKYASRHSDLDFRAFVIPQTPGSIERSTPVHGVLGSLLESKKYLVPLAILNPEVAGGMIAVYLGDRRFRPSKQPKIVFNAQVDREPGLLLASQPVPTSGDGGTASRDAAESIISRGEPERSVH